MRNPWLDIPLSDYECHMSLPYVAQAQLLSDAFATALNDYSPRSVAILGCAGGNGLERIDSKVTERVVCMDINPDYIEHARVRFGRQVRGLELHVGDVQTDGFTFTPVELVFAGLLFEYVNVHRALARIRAMLCPTGVVITVVQLPTSETPEVTPSPYASLGALSSVMRLVPPEVLRHHAAACDYFEAGAETLEASGGKRFQVQAFGLRTPTHRPASAPSEHG